MLEQMGLWDTRSCDAFTVRTYLEQLEPSVPPFGLADELYLDLHRACATSRPDQKRHNRSLERLVRGGSHGCLAQLRGRPGP